MGFHYLVHRPVHPDALRLLLTRLLYRGPEKRRAERVAVGAPISFRAGLRRRSGTLVELSATGCRLVAGVTPARGAQITVSFPDPDGGRAIPVRGCVLRVAILDRSREIAVSFGPQTDAARARIERMVALHTGGPAAWAGSSLPGPARPSGRRDQRRNRRGVYRKRVIALFEGGARVLLGRDLSVGGMRVESGGDLEGGQIVSLALYGSRSRIRWWCVRGSCVAGFRERACFDSSTSTTPCAISWRSSSPSSRKSSLSVRSAEPPTHRRHHTLR